MGAAAIEPDILSRVNDPEAQRFLREKWDAVEEHFAPLHCILFGSRINGTPHEFSDIDLIIVSEKFRDIRFIWRADSFREIIDPHVIMTALCYTPESSPTCAPASASCPTPVVKGCG